MRKIISLAIVLTVLVLILGCASSTLTVYTPRTEEPVAVIEQSFLGRGCVAVDITPEGTVSVIVQQDGSSDWSLSRLLGWLGDIAGNVFGADRRGSEMQGPDAAQGCAGLFESMPR